MGEVILFGETARRGVGWILFLLLKSGSGMFWKTGEKGG